MPTEWWMYVIPALGIVLTAIFALAVSGVLTDNP